MKTNTDASFAERGEKRPPLPHLMRLIHDISRLTHEQIRADCPQMQHSCRLIMMELARQDNVTQLDLVRATHLKPPTVSVSLQKMENDGLVLRRQDEKDLRATRVSLTENGRAMDNQILSRFRKEEEHMIRCLTEAEAETLETLLLKIKKHITENKLSDEEN